MTAHSCRLHAIGARKHRLGVALSSCCRDCGELSLVIVSEEAATDYLGGVRPRGARRD